MAKAKLKKVTVKLPWFTGEWEADETEQRAAWQLYVELMTRVTLHGRVPDRPGRLKPMFDSLYSLFPTTREVLRTAGPSVVHGPASLGPIALDLLNKCLRPFLDEFHGAFEAYMAKKPLNAPSEQYDAAWPERNKCYKRLQDLRKPLEAYSSMLAEAAGVRE